MKEKNAATGTATTTTLRKPRTPRALTELELETKKLAADAKSLAKILPAVSALSKWGIEKLNRYIVDLHPES